MFNYMMDTSNAFGNYINHLEEREQIINAVGKGKPLPKIAEYYDTIEISEMEDEIWSKYGIEVDLSFLL